MLKFLYIKPQIEIIEIRIESTITNSSDYPGTTTSPHSPEIEDFQDSPSFDGIGDL